MLIKQHMKEEKDALDNHKGALKKNFFRYTMPFCHFTGFNLWLLKPTKLNRGRGIHVINNLTQLKALIQRYCEGWKPNAVLPPAPAPAVAPQNKPAIKEDKVEVVNQYETQPNSPDKDGTGNDIATDEDEETTQPSSLLPPLPTLEEVSAPPNGSRLNSNQPPQ